MDSVLQQPRAPDGFNAMWAGEKKNNFAPPPKQKLGQFTSKVDQAQRKSHQMLQKQQIVPNSDVKASLGKKKNPQHPVV